MKTIIIELGDVLRDELRWLAFSRSNLSAIYPAGQTVTLDFSKVTFVVPYPLLSMIAYCRFISSMTNMRVHLVNIPQVIYQYMERTDFLRIVSDAIFIEGDYSGTPLWSRDTAPSKKLHGIVEISRNRNDSAQKIAESIIELNAEYDNILGFFGRDHKNADLFFTILSEITANVPEHSGSEGYLLVQKYERQNGTIVTSVSIMDIGIGIRARLRQQIARNQRSPFAGRPKDSDYLKFAFSRDGTRSGAGLHSVLQAMSSWPPSDTALLAVSGKALMYKGQGDGEPKFTETDAAFHGTHVTLWFYGKSGT